VAADDGWGPDPYGCHDERYFFFGMATHRVRDAGVESWDAPPHFWERTPSARNATGTFVQEPMPGVMVTAELPSPTVTEHPADELDEVEPAPPSEPSEAAEPSSLTWDDLLGPTVPHGDSSDDRAPRHAGRRSLLRVASVGVLGVGAIAVLVAALSGSPSPNRSVPSSVRTRASTAATSSAPVPAGSSNQTTTTQSIPPSPKASADQAANALVSAWAAGNQGQALAVATPVAVATLWANRYQSGLAIDRGCNTDSPSTCAFGPPGGASPSDPLYKITVSQAPAGGWYVSSVLVEGG